MQISVRELKSRLSETLRRVAAGEEVLVTSRGKAVARLLPPRKSGRRPALSNEEEAIALLRNQPWIRPGAVGKRRVGLTRPIKLKPGEKSLSDIVSEMRD